MSGNVDYSITPKASAALCDTAPKADASSCFGVFHSSEGLKVKVMAYWQRRCVWGCIVSEIKCLIRVLIIYFFDF